MVKVYRATLSGVLGGQCRFYPSCSAYAEDAIRSRGAILGTTLAIWRVLRCNPFGRGGVEEAPAPRGRTTAVVPPHESSPYENLTQERNQEVSA